MIHRTRNAFNKIDVSIATLKNMNFELSENYIYVYVLKLRFTIWMTHYLRFEITIYDLDDFIS